jgi:hypothetical protein
MGSWFSTSEMDENVTIIISDNKPMDERIVDACSKILSLDEASEIEKKRKSCHYIVMGRKMENYNILSKWGTGEFEKPQYMHSASSIYLLIKYPHLRPANSFINLIIREGQENVDAWFKIATDVLNDDPDGVNFIKISDEIFLKPNPNLILQHNDI